MSLTDNLENYSSDVDANFIIKNYPERARELGLINDESEGDSEWDGSLFFGDEDDGSKSAAERLLDSLSSGNSDSSSSGDTPYYSPSEGQTLDEIINGKKASETDAADNAIAYLMGGIVGFFIIHQQLVQSFLNKEREDFGKFFINLRNFSLFLLFPVGIMAYTQVERFIFPVKDMLVAVICLVGVSVLADKIQIKKSEDNTLAEFEEEYGENDSNEEEEVEEESFEGDEVEEFEEIIDNDDINNFDDEQLLQGINNVPSKINDFSLMSPEYTYSIFKPLLVHCTRDFNKETSIEKGSKLWLLLHFVFNKAMDEIYNKPNLNVNFVSVKENKFCVTIRTKKIPTLNYSSLLRHLDSFAAMFKSQENENIGMDLTESTGDFIFRIYKSGKPIVTIGDVLLNGSIRDRLFSNDKDILPFLAGLYKNSDPYLIDLAKHPHVLITGATNAGKGWLVYYMIYHLALFNPPTKISFVMLDPKKSPSFRSMGNLPHVVHIEREMDNFSSVLGYISKEAEFRKDLFDRLDINDYNSYYKIHSRNLELPFIFVVIDEINVFKEKRTKEQHEEFMSKLKIMAFEYRAFGIKLVLIGQVARADSLDKNIKRMCEIRYGVKSTNTEAEFLFDVNKVDLALLEPGDIGLMVGQKIDQIRQPTVAFDEESNQLCFSALGSAWIKTGCALPKFKYLGAIDSREKRIKSNIDALNKGQIGLGTSRIEGSIFDNIKQASTPMVKSNASNKKDTFIEDFLSEGTDFIQVDEDTMSSDEVIEEINAVKISNEDIDDKEAIRKAIILSGKNKSSLSFGKFVEESNQKDKTKSADIISNVDEIDLDSLDSLGNNPTKSVDAIEIAEEHFNVHEEDEYFEEIQQ